ncbi:Wp [Nautilia profundicola AmH]|uniref:Wp n=1 Tax=Nautilia profundicola (strain ATCC BAA-1463 / DSM 18972 / AmH) TaxID=598659 RepID=B9L8L8_NAUPA|nr:thioredoxin family protein [Nautilia profundicola]ACM93148.1 Wp [Nautilia profundicola AmH]
MKKLLVFLLLISSLFAVDWSGKINWAMNYNIAQSIAKSSDKLIMVDIALTTCPPCKYLAEKVYTDPEVSKYINDNFVAVFYLADQDSLPPTVQNYFTGSTPTILFLKPNGELVYSMIGARPPQAFLQIIKNVNNKYKGNK